MTLANQLRRTERARNFPSGTCAASRHVHIMAKTLARGDTYHMLNDEPQHCAESLLAVLESLWKARAELSKSRPGKD